jgi:hypothetical protein
VKMPELYRGWWLIVRGRGRERSASMIRVGRFMIRGAAMAREGAFAPQDATSGRLGAHQRSLKGELVFNHRTC